MLGLVVKQLCKVCLTLVALLEVRGELCWDFQRGGCGLSKGFAADQRNDFKLLCEWKPLAEKCASPVQCGCAVQRRTRRTAGLKTAAKWFKLAAKRGVARAQLNLGVMYAKGEGVTEL